MIATITTGIPREAHRETPESGNLVDTEVSAPPAAVQRAFAEKLRLCTAAPTAPIRPRSTAPLSVAEPIHIMSKAVAAPSPWCSTKASNVPVPIALAGGARIVANVVPVGIHSESTAVTMPTPYRGSPAFSPAGVVEIGSPCTGKIPRADQTAMATAAIASKRPRVTLKGILL